MGFLKIILILNALRSKKPYWHHDKMTRTAAVTVQGAPLEAKDGPWSAQDGVFPSQDGANQGFMKDQALFFYETDAVSDPLAIKTREISCARPTSHGTHYQNTQRSYSY
jgi:hypothetical protein